MNDLMRDAIVHDLMRDAIISDLNRADKINIEGDFAAFDLMKQARLPNSIKDMKSYQKTEDKRIEQNAFKRHTKGQVNYAGKANVGKFN